MPATCNQGRARGKPGREASREESEPSSNASSTLPTAGRSVEPDVALRRQPKDLAGCMHACSAACRHRVSGRRHAAPTAPHRTCASSFLATAPAATRPIVSRADERPPPATARMPYLKSYVASGQGCRRMAEGVKYACAKGAFKGAQAGRRAQQGGGATRPRVAACLRRAGRRGPHPAYPHGWGGRPPRSRSSLQTAGPCCAPAGGDIEECRSWLIH